jgi:hypothetical protein
VDGSGSMIAFSDEHQDSGTTVFVTWLRNSIFVRGGGGGRQYMPLYRLKQRFPNFL